MDRRPGGRSHGVAVRHDRLTERQSVVFTAECFSRLVVCFPIYCVWMLRAFTQWYLLAF